MGDLRSAIREAVEAGIISDDQGGRLTSHFAERGLVAESSGLLSGLSEQRNQEPKPAVEESESPRFIRGFHDILISIGVIAALVGLWGMVGPIAVLLGTVALSEVLVRQQRLALPAFFLTIFFSGAAGHVAWPLVESIGKVHGSAPAGLVVMLAPLVGLIPYYLRYRVPFALAAMILCAVASLYLFVMASLGGVMSDDVLEHRPVLSAAVGLVFALALFAIAMVFDIGDRERLTRRSDVAFWLHLATAPALLYSILAVLLHDGDSRFWIKSWADSDQAVLVIVVVAVFMLVGILIDRRAFVTSGLISLGVAIAYLVRSYHIDMQQFGMLPILAVGIIVLMLGTGWQRLRELMLSGMPESVKRILPPVAKEVRA